MDTLDALIFVDTNIYLDFYRARQSDSALSLLDRLLSQVDRVVSTSQVEMEYLKNRQDVILESLRGIKNPDWQMPVPALFAQAQPAKALDAHRKEIEKQLKKLRARVEAVLKDPRTNDPVFRKSSSIFRHSGPHVLSRDNDARATMRRLAWRRFILGYPPRKDKDTSMGDAINWEWMLHCTQHSGKHLIIVSRDSDYGRQYSKAPIVNDWLRQEFRERIGPRRKLVLTDRLAEAFKLISAPVSPTEAASEAALIAEVKSTPKSVSAWDKALALLSPQEMGVFRAVRTEDGTRLPIEQAMAATGLSAEEILTLLQSGVAKMQAFVAQSLPPVA
jgi:predicted nucleic acid-binding protein